MIFTLAVSDPAPECGQPLKARLIYGDFNKDISDVALTYHPKPGTILMCDFGQGFQSPEMVKKRPVIVVSPKRKRCSGLCTIVAISTVPPTPVEHWNYMLPGAWLPQTPYFQAKPSWVKGDMIYRVAFHRLEGIKIGKDKVTGRRLYFNQVLDDEQMKKVYSCVLHALNLGNLQNHL